MHTKYVLKASEQALRRCTSFNTYFVCILYHIFYYILRHQKRR
jgi:hypothetical protein